MPGEKQPLAATAGIGVGAFDKRLKVRYSIFKKSLLLEEKRRR